LKRKLIEELIRWKSENSDTPILLTGAKGVGKTFLAYDFAKAFFEQISYINFEHNPEGASFFCALDAEELTSQMTDYFQLSESSPIEGRILILDEIGRCEEALHALDKGLFHDCFQYIIAISSHPLTKEQETVFTKLSVHPLEFDEFLKAIGSDWYIEAIMNHFYSNTNIPEIVHKELLSLHRLYLQIGGMPGLVNEYLNFSDAVNVSEQHSFIVGSYHDYINRDNTDSDSLKMKQVFDSLTYQLMKDNKKFQYKIIRKGTTHAMYRDAIQKLVEQNYVIRCNKINTDQLQNPSELILLNNSCDASNSNFKLYLPDTGLLYSKIIEEQGTNGVVNNKKALLENYVAQSLQAKNYPFVFWESESMAKIDFIIAKNLEIIPIEIHESSNTRSKSISVLRQKCEFPYAIKISSKNFEYSNQIKYVPYYAVFCL
jgi:predicted AAA+ superfamily ATPase